MRLTVCLATTFLVTGCGAYYEEVPAFGQTDPNYAMQEQQPQQRIVQQGTQGTVAGIGDNQAQLGVDPGQDVNVGQPNDEYSDTDPSALTDFKQTLDPYGTWGDDPQYGTVWQPDPGVVGADFAPYVTGGHWGYENADYTWNSDYDWGWAPFHYGRWVYIASRGWSWIPGRRYAGAWVDWRVGGPGYGYVGWGPMAPTWGWRNGSAFGYGFRGTTPYTFCGTGDLFSPSLHGRTIAGPEVNVIANNTHPFVDGRTAAHPTVGPGLSHLGVAPPPVLRTPGIARAQMFARPSTASNFGAHAPMYGAGALHATNPSAYPPHGVVGENRPVVTAPRYVGVSPQPYHAGPIARPYGGAYGGQPYRSYGGGYGGGAYGRAPTYTSPYRSYGGSTYGGGGAYGGRTYGGAGGGYHAPTTTYSHPSYSHGSGGGSHGGGGHGGGHR